MNSRIFWMLGSVLAIVGVGSLPPATAAAGANRTTLSLDGQWDVEDSVAANEMPKSYTHKAPVPGLAHSAVPAFPDVDQYQSRELLSNLVRQGRYPAADFAKLGDARGISRQQRNYFWYRKTFTAPAQNAVTQQHQCARFGVSLGGITVFAARRISAFRPVESALIETSIA